jgi:hypothetical protein
MQRFGLPAEAWLANLEQKGRRVGRRIQVPLIVDCGALFTFLVDGTVQHGVRIGRLYAANRQLTYDVSASVYGWSNDSMGRSCSRSDQPMA